MTVHATRVSSSSSQDEEVCDFLQGDFWSIFVDMIILINKVVTLKQHEEQEQGVEFGRDANLWEIWNLVTVSFAVILSQYHPPHYTSYTHKLTQFLDQVVDVAQDFIHSLTWRVEHQPMLPWM